MKLTASAAVQVEVEVGVQEAGGAVGHQGGVGEADSADEAQAGAVGSVAGAGCQSSAAEVAAGAPGGGVALAEGAAWEAAGVAEAAHDEPPAVLWWTATGTRGSRTLLILSRSDQKIALKIRNSLSVQKPLPGTLTLWLCTAFSGGLRSAN